MEGALRAPGLMADIVQVLVQLPNHTAVIGRLKTKRNRNVRCNHINLNLQTGQLGLEQRGRSGSLHQVVWTFFRRLQLLWQDGSIIFSSNSPSSASRMRATSSRPRWEAPIHLGRFSQKKQRSFELRMTATVTHQRWLHQTACREL